MRRLSKWQLVFLLGSLVVIEIRKRSLESVIIQACVGGLLVWCCAEIARSSIRRARERDRFLQTHVLKLKKRMFLARQFNKFYVVANQAPGRTRINPGAQLTGHSDWRKYVPFGDSGPWNERRILFAVDKTDVTGPIDTECTRGDKVIVDFTPFVGMQDGELVVKDSGRVALAPLQARGAAAPTGLAADMQEV